MPLQRTLEKVEFDVDNGDLGKARDRLLGLLVTYPNDLSLRRKLGDIYWELQYPVLAGRYWFLEEEKTSEMEFASKQFVRMEGENPLRILVALKFRGDLKAIEDRYAGKTLIDLYQRAREKWGDYADRAFQTNAEKKERHNRKPPKGKDNGITCLLVVLLVLILTVIGIITIVGWILRLFQR